jgi:hypothetical protein
MPMTWYVARGGGAVVSDASEAYGFSEVVRVGEPSEGVSTAGELVVVVSSVGLSVIVRLGELCDDVSTAGELVVVASLVGFSVVLRVDELCEAVSTAGELVVVASLVGLSVVVRVDELCEAVSTGGELVAVASSVAGVDEVSTDGRFASFVTPRIANTSNTPVNSAIVPTESFFTREACVGSGGGTAVVFGGAPQEGQAVANELISLPQSKQRIRAIFCSVGARPCCRRLFVR